MPAQRALELGARRDATGPAPSQAEHRARSPVPAPAARAWLEAPAFVLAVLAIASLGRAARPPAWATAVVERALLVALPLTLGAPVGAAQPLPGPAEGPRSSSHAGAARCCVGALRARRRCPRRCSGLSGLVAGLLTLTWTGGTLLMRRRWTGAYAAIVIGGTGPMMADVPPLATLGGIAAATTLAVAVALRAAAPSTRIAPGRWDRAFVGAALGAGIGVMLVGDSSVTWTEGTVPALALLPSTVAGFWGGYHLWKIEHVIPHALLGVPAADAGARAAASAPLRMLLGAAGRLVGLTAVLSVALVLLTPGSTRRRAARACSSASACWRWRRCSSACWRRWGAAAGRCSPSWAGWRAEALVALQGSAPFPGAALVAGSGLVVLLLLPAAIALVRRPARTLATALWIR